MDEALRHCLTGADVCAWMKWVVGFEGRFRVEDAVIGGHVVVHLVTVRAPRSTRCGWPQRESRPNANYFNYPINYGNNNTGKSTICFPIWPVFLYSFAFIAAYLEYRIFLFLSVEAARYSLILTYSKAFCALLNSISYDFFTLERA